MKASPARAPRLLRLAAAAALLLGSAPAAAQDLNLLYPVPTIERWLAAEPFRIVDWRGSRRPDDRTQRATLVFEDSVVIAAKWGTAPRNGGAFNNEPRYEVAAYVIQRLFLDEDEYVVPPTVLRAVPLAFLQEQVPDAAPTFSAAPRSALVALQYWLTGVTPEGFWSAERARNDSVYARYIGNFNILTYVIRHSDANVGNYLISTSAERPRVFAVDNGIAFASTESNRGTEWRELNVRRLPRATIERLRQVTRKQLEETLGVLAEFDIRDGELVAVPPGENIRPNQGVRRRDGKVQIGLTGSEIGALEARILELLRLAHGRELF